MTILKCRFRIAIAIISSLILLLCVILTFKRRIVLKSKSTVPCRWAKSRTDVTDMTKAMNTDKNALVPRIVHFVWYHPTKLTFRFHHFMSFLAAYKRIKPDTIMFWYEKYPQGIWWNRALEIYPDVDMRYRPTPTSICGNAVNVPEHASDIVRMEVILEYGGIYLDLDVIALKSFDPLLVYNTTLGYESKSCLCNGVIIAAPGAEFLKIWYSNYNTFDDDEWGIHSVHLPGRLADKYPQLIHTEWDTLHRPRWGEEIQLIYGIGSSYNWRRNYAIHLWYRHYDVDHDLEDIKYLNSTLGQIFRYTYYDSPALWNRKHVKKN